jgi:2,3-diketo-5-methylthio-1-phosphopentane phosphatase
MNLIVVSDFDGTISLKDGISELFSNHMGIQQKNDSEKLVDIGKISHCEQLQMGFNCVPFYKNIKQLASVYEIDPTFKTFYQHITKQNIPFYICSAGIKKLIKGCIPYVLDNQVFANDMDLNYKSKSYLIKPYGTNGVDKPKIIEQLKTIYPNKIIVYYGDGRSDFDVCTKAHIVFAKKDSALEHFCIEKQIYHICFQSFSDTLNNSFIYNPRPLHIHFGLGALTCGYLLDHLDIINKQYADVLVVRRSYTYNHVYIHNRHNHNSHSQTYLSNDCSYENNIILFDFNTLDKMLYVIKRLNKRFCTSISVGCKNFDSIYTKIRSNFPNVEIFAFENFLLRNCDIRDDNLVCCFADKICTCTNTKQLHNTNRYILDTVQEDYVGKLMIPRTFYHCPVYSDNDIQMAGILKIYSLNFIQLLIALYAKEEDFNYNEVISENITILAKLSLLISVFISKVYRIEYSKIIQALKTNIQRIRCHGNDKRSRITRNLDIKYTTIIKPFLFFSSVNVIRNERK